ncbi:MAG: bifunctional demethylmenaquinone methyltransferase/2-methoxy-6-polyprenyl-1,4-benzoquinol methylase UbiE [Bacteroidales bacterium]|nr:bifunctional demethylmenaquinone methyltransferase/2-methoxy-6-polyprenyl-1,4-benzoquinol methylase UbiE [Bacteroidales bacterium]
MMQEKDQLRRSPRHEVEAMFDSISPHYDLLNRVLSLGTDRRWRRRAVSLIGRHVTPARILDVATGTGDLAIAAMKLGPEKITGIDISSEMLAVGRRKVEKMGLAGSIELLRGDSLFMDFSDGTFDVAMSAFGVRNFEETVTGLREMHRVLRPGGMVVVLEFSKPSWFPMKQIYGFYFRRILPRIGRSVSGDPGAYSYLPESVTTFPDNEAFLELLLEAGFREVRQKQLTGGIASIYYGFRT